MLEVWYRLSGRRGEALDMYVSSKLCFEVRVRDFEQGALRNVDTGEVLNPPFILDPGEYHLEATPAEEDKVEHGVPESAEEPSQTN